MILDCRYDRITGEKFYEFCVGVGGQVLEATHLMLKFKYLCFFIISNIIGIRICHSFAAGFLLEFLTYLCYGFFMIHGLLLDK